MNTSATATRESVAYVLRLLLALDVAAPSAEQLRRVKRGEGGGEEQAALWRALHDVVALCVARFPLGAGTALAAAWQAGAPDGGVPADGARVGPPGAPGSAFPLCAARPPRLTLPPASRGFRGPPPGRLGLPCRRAGAAAGRGARPRRSGTRGGRPPLAPGAGLGAARHARAAARATGAPGGADGAFRTREVARGEPD